MGLRRNVHARISRRLPRRWRSAQGPSAPSRSSKMAVTDAKAYARPRAGLLRQDLSFGDRGHACDSVHSDHRRYQVRSRSLRRLAAELTVSALSPSYRRVAKQAPPDSKPRLFVTGHRCVHIAFRSRRRSSSAEAILVAQSRSRHGIALHGEGECLRLRAIERRRSELTTRTVLQLLECPSDIGSVVIRDAYLFGTPRACSTVLASRVRQLVLS